MEIKVEYLELDKLIPYINNPRKNDAAVDYVMESIKKFGFKVPIVIDKNNVIVTGHTRLKASKRLGLKKVPVIRANDLNEEQVKAFRIADNKVSEFASWDIEKLGLELEEIDLIDMATLGIDLDSINIDNVEIDFDKYYGDERERTNKAYNLNLIENNEADFWQMPIIKNDNFTPNDLVGFNYAKTNKDKNVGIHFYIDDYQFERVWNTPEKYIDLLLEYDCILTPDFSLYLDMPMPMKIWNVYRSRFIGAYYQSKGLKVIPTISWAEPETFEFCFKGIPKGSIVSISTIGVKEDKKALEIWENGVDEMLQQIEPSTVLVYGGKIEHDYKGTQVIYFDNKVTKRWQEG